MLVADINSFFTGEGGGGGGGEKPGGEMQAQELTTAPAISFDLQEIAGNCKGNKSRGPLTHQEVVSLCE